MTKPNYLNAENILDKQNRAIEEARSELRTKGVYFPVRYPGMSDIEYHDSLLNYAKQEAALIVKILRRPAGGERPLAIDNVEPKKQWGRSWYE